MISRQIIESFKRINKARIKLKEQQNNDTKRNRLE